MVAPSVNILPANILRATLGRLSVVERIFVSSIGNPLGDARRAAYRKKRLRDFRFARRLVEYATKILRVASSDSVRKACFQY
jgi:hypothetical protein